MTDREFLRLNENLRRQQRAIREEWERSEPVHIKEVLPGVMDDILKRGGEEE